MLASKVIRALLAALLLTAAVSTAQVAAPGATFACSCGMPRPLVGWRAEPTVVILAGTIEAVNAQRGIFAVERVFKGPVPGATIPIQGGDGAMCGVSLKAGARIVMVASLDKGVVNPSSCLPFATLPSAQGDALVAEAVAAYGGEPPPGAPAEPTDPPATAPLVATDVALPMVLIGVLVIVGVLFGVVALIARRGRASA